jgi:Flp pilus assembly protein TadG
VSAMLGAQARLSASRGQAMVEFALISVIAAFVLFGSIQLSLLGQVSLALSQAAYRGSRYAAINPSADQSAVASYVKSIAAPTLLSNSGNDLTVTLTPNAPRTIGTSVTVSLSYNLQSKIFLPNPFFGVRLPTSLSYVNSSYSE